MPSRRKLIFDTSAINALANDPDSAAITASLGAAYRVGITETVISEVIADPDAARRTGRFDLMKRLLGAGNCLMPFNWIIEEQAKSYVRDPSAYEWKRLDVRLRMGEEEIVRQEFIHSLSDETLLNQRHWENGFKAIFENARPAFQRIFEDEAGPQPSLQKVTSILLGDGGAHLSIGSTLVEAASGTRLEEVQVKDFIERCPPFNALLVALCVAQYDRCIRGEGEPSLGKAGRNDMFSAVYFSYCGIFVTNDRGQCKALTAVADLMHWPVSVVLYSEFRSRLIGLPI
jgi:hypothetical protein